MEDTPKFVIMFIDSGTFTGRVSNILSSLGGWPVTFSLMR
jgi:hypothetical protein